MHLILALIEDAYENVALVEWFEFTLEYSYQCQKITFNHSSSNIQLRNEYEVAILLSELENIRIIRDGAIPKSPDEIFDFKPDSGEYFSILPKWVHVHPL